MFDKEIHTCGCVIKVIFLWSKIYNGKQRRAIDARRDYFHIAYLAACLGSGTFESSTIL